MLKVGFDVPAWSNKPFNTFTNEELLEYYYKLRLVCKNKTITGNSTSSELYTCSLQQEIISRMKSGHALEEYQHILGLCDPRDNYGDGPECQFCHAKDGERHKPNCTYVLLTTEAKQ